MRTKAPTNVVAINSAVQLPKSPRRYVRLTASANTKLEKTLLELLEVSESGLGKADYAEVAQLFGVSLRTVEDRAARLRRKRRGKGGDGPDTPAPALPDDALELIATKGQIHGAWQQLVDEDRYTQCSTTFWRQVNSEFGANVIRGVCKGIPAMRTGTFEKVQRPPFMHAFSTDLFALRAPLAGGKDGDTAMGIFVREMHTGKVLFTWAWPDNHVDADDVATVVAETMRGRTIIVDGKEWFIGGVPDIFSTDNGGPVTAASLSELLVPLGVRPRTSTSYLKYEAGFHERTHRTARGDFLSQIPGSQDGPRDHNGELLPDERPLLTIDEIRDLLDKWAWKFNNTDRGDGSPLQRWIQCVEQSRRTLPAPVDTEFLAQFAVKHRTTVKRYKWGVRLKNEHYVTDQLDRFPHDRYWLRSWLRDTRTVELFTTAGSYIGPAVRNGDLTAAEGTHLQQSRVNSEKVARDTVAKAHRAGGRTTAANDTAASAAQTMPSHLGVEQLLQDLTQNCESDGGQP